jgi:hypothetical protein
MHPSIRSVGVGLAFFLCSLLQATAEPCSHIPSTISPEAQALLRSLPDPHTLPAAPRPDEVDKWTALQAATIEATLKQRAEPGLPETDLALAKVAAFLDQYLVR